MFCYYASLSLFSKMTCFSLSSLKSKRKDRAAKAEKGGVVKHLHSFCWNVRTTIFLLHFTCTVVPKEKQS